MACSHLNAIARKKIKSLETEIEKYNDFIQKVTDVQKILESYATFLNNLGGLLQDVRLTGYPYDNGKCASNAKKLINLKDGDLAAMITSANAAIAEINNEDIKEQQNIINTWSECGICKKARLNASAAESGTKVVGGGPVPTTYREVSLK